MKNNYFKNRKTQKLNLRFSALFLSFTVFFTISLSVISQNVGINPNGALPDASAILDLKANDKGLLIPRLTTIERDAIQNPAMSLLIFNTQTECFEAWSSSASTWVSFGCIGCILPTVPTASAGTNINSTDFDANWSASNGVIDYYLDVATDIGFTTFVSGFNNINIGNVITYNVTGLTCGVDYYYRVRAENACGLSSYSNTITVTTAACFSCGNPITDVRDNKTYQTVQIGSQCWMAENLNYDAGNNNSYCYNNNPNNCITYGRLYNWTGAMAGASSSNSNPSGVQGACPNGWHLPSDVEWCQLENTVEPGTDAGCNSLGTRGTNLGHHLRAVTWGGDNSSGFNVLPSGYYSGTFDFIGSNANFWTATESGASAWKRDFYTGNSGVYRNMYPKNYGYGVRCVKD